jgi:hypothetical protein
MIGRLIKATLPDGRVVISEGHIACLHEGTGVQLDPAIGESQELSVMWAQQDALMTTPNRPRALIESGGFYLRYIGPDYIGEQYYRAMGGSTMKWCATAVNGKPIRVMDGDMMIGFVSPVHMTSIKKPAEVDEAIITDSDVFSRFACQANDWYLISDKALADH